MPSELVIPEGYGQARISFSLSGDPDPMGFGIGFKASVSATQAQGAAALAALEDDWSSTFISTAASFYQGWTYLGATATFNSSDGGVVHLEHPHVVAGTSIGETPPQNCTELVKKLTGSGGRKFRGRAYIPPFNLLENTVNKAGVLDAAVVANQQAGWDTFLAAANGDTAYDVYLLHRSMPKDGIVPPPTLITKFVMEQQIATQRRRLR